MCEWRIPDTGNESEGGAWGQETRVAGEVTWGRVEDQGRANGWGLR